MSRSSTEDWSSSRRGERTPLRSLENETPSSRIRSKPQFSGDTVKASMSDLHLCDTQTQLGTLTGSVSMDTTQSVCGLGDVTFKTFICSGGEVEISDSSDGGGQSLIFPKDGTTFTLTAETEDSVSSPSRTEQSCSEHVEHPYSNHSVEQPDSPITCEADEEKCLMWKSFACDGGQVEVSDSTGLQEETVPLPQDDLWGPAQDDGTNSADCTLLLPAEHVDHLYCSSGNDDLSTAQRSENPDDLTLKLLNCSGGEVEIPADADVADETIPLSHTCSGCNHSMDPSVLASDYDLGNSKDHLDHPYCNVKYNSSPPPEEVNTVPDVQPCSAEINSVLPHGQDEKFDWKSGESQVSEKMLTSPEENYNEEQMTDRLKNREADTNPPPESNASLKVVDEIPENTPLVASDCSRLDASAETLPQQQQLDSRSHSEAKDSALGSLGLCNSAEKAPPATPVILKVLSECPSVASALQFLSPIVKRASLSALKRPVVSGQDMFLPDDSALEDEKSLWAPVDVDSMGLLAEQLENPMPRPLLNSTVVSSKPQEDSGKKSQPETVPLIPDGQFQQQLRQMAEFLMMACGKMSADPPAAFMAPSDRADPPAAFMAPSDRADPPAAFMAPSDRADPAESHSVCVGTSPLKMVDHSLNTSGIFVKKREFSVTDSCTATEPLIWNLPAGSLESLPRLELEQRLMSSMIMVEALVQQLAAARAHRSPSSGPAPSDLREKLVQTDHTELSQTTMYRDLYMEALSRITELELDGNSLQNLVQAVQEMRAAMSSLSSDTDAALSNMKKMGETIREDHQNLASHYELMKSLFEKSKETQRRILEKVKEVLQQRSSMEARMEEAFTAKEAAFSAMDQLRTHCASEVSALEKCVGSQEELLVALNQTYPDQVALNRTCQETLSSASDLLSRTAEDHSSLMQELCSVRSLLQKTAPMLLQLNERAATALRERDEHRTARERAAEEKEQIEDELKETHLNLQTASQQISDLNLQITILTSEMGVLREKLTAGEEESAQLERKVTELSATISSTLASYAFLEQALAAETTKLQQSWKDLHEANERANQLQGSLSGSEQRVSELDWALAESDQQLGQLQNLYQSQTVQIQQLQEVCAQLGGVREMNEFLQMENELAREQVAESERMLRSNLQALRERNIECEDLKSEVYKLQLENQSLSDELETARCAAGAARMELQEKMAEAVTEITVLHHTLRGLTTQLQVSLSNQREEHQKQKESAMMSGAARHQTSGSFVDSVMVALTAEKEEDVRTDSTLDASEPQSDAFFSETSAFTRIAALNPKTISDPVQDEEEDEEEEQSSMAELLSGLSRTVAELISTLQQAQRCRDAQLQELHGTIGGLQVELQTSSSRHQAEVLELKQEVRRLSSLVEKGNQALQQKAQDEKTLTKLMADVQEAQEILSKHKSDNNELRRDAAELRRALQQSIVESQFLREELRRTGGPAAAPAHHMEEKIQLLKEVEKLKASLQEAEQAKFKLLERAKRHQIIHQTNQQKSENELQILNHMINKVRETLLSLPEVVKHCEQLQQLVDYIG
ncbi:sperm-associated antigen 5 isoform X1 [Poecilia latipinna]|uniref:Sperm associated antigen 5 n=1 Tax=Poecilia latipinna TaxID=48699 RepID=A0A3B3U6W5_9TELE|nr:PREDICTED: sperm-associated antigen 5 isoform X1 [Poecilia latipinna]